MKQHFTATKLVLLLAITAVTICISGFREKDSTQQKYFRTYTDGDTTKPGKRNTNTDAELEKAMKRLDEEMQKLDEKMKKMDFSKMQKELDASLSKIDFDKIGKEVEASLAKIDWKKIQGEINTEMEKVKQVDMEKIHEEIKKAHLEIEKHQGDMKGNMEKIKKEVGEEMEKAKESMKKAMEGIKFTKEFTDALEADGLINKKKGYKVEVKGGELFIDGNKQTPEVNEKFRKYFKKENFTIKDDGTSTISI